MKSKKTIKKYQGGGDTTKVTTFPSINLDSKETLNRLMKRASTPPIQYVPFKSEPKLSLKPKFSLKKGGSVGKKKK